MPGAAAENLLLSPQYFETVTNIFTLFLFLSLDLFNNGRGSAPSGVSRNSLEGAGYADLDLRLSRDIAFATGDRTCGGGSCSSPRGSSSD